MYLWTGCLLDQEKRMAGSTASKFNILLYFLMNCWGMRGFRSLLASFTLCPKKQSYQAQEDWKGRETGTIPTDVLPREAGNTLCCGKWEAEVSQSAQQVCASFGMGKTDNGLLCHPHPCLPCWWALLGHLGMQSAPPLCHSVVWKWGQGDKGGEWVVTTFLSALSLPLSKAGLGGVRRAQKKWESSREWAPIKIWKAKTPMDNEVARDASSHTDLFPSFRSFVPSSSLCLGMLRDCTKSLDKTNIWRSPQEAGRYY